MTHRTMGIMLIVVALSTVIGGIYWWKTGTGPRNTFISNQNSEDSSPRPSPTPEPNPHRIQGWIGEGVPVIKAARKGNVPVYQNPGDTQSLGNVLVEKGETINWSESQIIVREKGSITWNTTTPVFAFEYPLLNSMPIIRDETLREQIFEAGKSVDYLIPRLEGSIVVYVDHKYLGVAGEIDGTDPAFTIIKQPITEFWVYALVTKDSGGWVKVDNEILEISGRKF